MRTMMCNVYRVGPNLFTESEKALLLDKKDDNKLIKHSIKMKIRVNNTGARWLFQ